MGMTQVNLYSFYTYVSYFIVKKCVTVCIDGVFFFFFLFFKFWLKYACQYQDAPPESSIASALKAQWRRLPALVAHALPSFGPIADLCR